MGREKLGTRVARAIIMSAEENQEMKAECLFVDALARSIINGVIVIIISCGTYKYCTYNPFGNTERQTGNEQGGKLMFYLVGLMFALQIVYMFAGAIEAIIVCQEENETLRNVFAFLTFGLWSMQYSLLIFFFFHRLVGIFGSAMMNQISPCTRKSFYFIFIVSILIECVVLLCAAVFPSEYSSMARIMFPIVCGFMLILIVQSSTLMAYHFISFHRNINRTKTDEKMICTATKITLLNTVCVLSFFGASAYKSGIESYGRNHQTGNLYLHLKIASRMIWSLDTLINFMTVYLSLKFTNGCYMKVCGCGHNLFRRGCAKAMVKKSETVIASVLALELETTTQQQTEEKSSE